MKDRKRIYGKGNIEKIKVDVKNFFQMNIKRSRDLRIKRLKELKARRSNSQVPKADKLEAVGKFDSVSASGFTTMD